MPSFKRFMSSRFRTIIRYKISLMETLLTLTLKELFSYFFIQGVPLGSVPSEVKIFLYLVTKKSFQRIFEIKKKSTEKSAILPHCVVHPLTFSTSSITLTFRTP